MKTNENKPAETEAPETETDIEIIEELVTTYYHKHEASPFKDFQVKEDDQMAVDMDASFEESINKAFGERSSEALGEYISELIRSLVENLNEDELKELKEVQKQETEDTKEA